MIPIARAAAPPAEAPCSCLSAGPGSSQHAGTRNEVFEGEPSSSDQFSFTKPSTWQLINGTSPGVRLAERSLFFLNDPPTALVLICYLNVTERHLSVTPCVFLQLNSDLQPFVKNGSGESASFSLSAAPVVFHRQIVGKEKWNQQLQQVSLQDVFLLLYVWLKH